MRVIVEQDTLRTPARWTDPAPGRSRLRSRHLVLACSLLVVALTAGLLSLLRAPDDPGPAGAPGDAVPAGAPHVATWAVDLNADPADDGRLHGPQRTVVVLNAWEGERRAQLEAESPQTRVLVYKDMASVRSYPGALDGGRDAELLPTGVGYAEAEAADPGWFLTDAAGERLEWVDHPGHWHVDVGDPDYQRTWLENVGAELEAGGWDGVMIDNALSRADLYTPGRAPARYPTDEAMQQATRSMLAAVGPALRERGFEVHANIGDSRLVPGLWTDWGSLLSGPVEENFVSFRSGDGYGRLQDDSDEGWRRQVDQLAASEAAGQVPLVNVKGAADDPSALRYGLASFLLATRGAGLFSYDPSGWFPEYEFDLGLPQGPYSRLPQGIYGRDFERGLVLVNPSASEVGYDLPRPYVDEQGETVTRLRLPPTSGSILRRP